MDLFNRFKKVTKDIKETIDESEVIDRTVETANELKDLTQETSSIFREKRDERAFEPFEDPELYQTQSEYLVVRVKKDNWLDKVAVALEKKELTHIEIDHEKYEVVGRYLKRGKKDTAGIGKVKLILRDAAEEQTRIQMKLSILNDKTSVENRHYLAIYNALIACFNKEDVLETETFQGTAEQRERMRKRKERKQEMAKKRDAVYENAEEGTEGLFDRYSKKELVQFTEEYYEKIVLAGSHLGHSSLRMGNYIEERELEKAKEGYADQLDDSEEVLVFYSFGYEESFILTDRNLYYSMKEVTENKLISGTINVGDIQKITVVNERKGQAEIFINGVSLFYMNILSSRDDYESIKLYFEKLTSGDFVTTEKEISTQLESKLSKKLLERIRGFMHEDENILYIAWGLDSITATDYIVCTTDHLLLIDRDQFGLGEHIKQFAYEDIVTISTVKSADGAFLSNVLATAFKQTDIEIYSAGTSFRIEMLTRIEAEEVIKIVNDKKREVNRPAPIAEPIEPQQVHNQASSQTIPQGNPINQITQLAKLRDQGILTEAEFELKKAELLKKL